MLDMYEISSITNTKTFEKGLDLYNRNKFITFHYDGDEDVEVDDIHALVEGSGDNEYQVDVTYDYGTDTVLQYTCDCPAYRTYAGPCKHIVATMLQYIEIVEAQEWGAEDDVIEPDWMDEMYPEGRTSVDVHRQNVIDFLERAQGRTINKPVKHATSPEVRRLFQPPAMHDHKPFLQQTVTKKVRLEPCIQVSNYGLTIEFKIGHDRMYVLKNIMDFTYRVVSERYHEYGKSLSFVHGMNAFEESSKGMVDFLVRVTEEMRNRYYYGPPVKRELPVSTDGLAFFLRNSGLNSIQVSVDGKASKSYVITEEKLHRTMEIVGKDDGIEVSIDKLEGFAGEDAYIYFRDQKIYLVDTLSIEPIQEFLTLMARRPDRRIFIDEDDRMNFCRYLLPDLEEHYDITRVNFNEDDYLLEQASFEIYLDLPEKDTISCKVMIQYGEKSVNLYGYEQLEIRDRVLETKVNKAVSRYFNEFDESKSLLLLIGDEERLYELLTTGLADLQNYGEIFISDKLKKVNVMTHTPVKVGVSIKSDLLELSMISDTLSQHQLSELLTHYNPKKKYYRLKNGDFINVGEGELEALHELKQGLNLSEKAMMGDVISLPKYRALYIDEQLKKNQGAPLSRDKSFKALIGNMKTVEENDFDLPVSLEEVLRSYQRNGFLWMKTLNENGFGGILADDMGLGKTLQVISFLKSELETKEAVGRTLIVSPSSLVYNWKNEFEKFAPDMSVTTVSGAPGEREQLIVHSGESEILITSYDLLKRDIAHYSNMTFSYQVIDEAQFIKNSNTQAAKAVKAVTASFKLALTGTPIENRLSELWSIFDYLMPGFLHSYRKFKSEFESPVVQEQDEKVTERLKMMISPFVLRRLKKDVLTDLPDKIEENVVVAIDGEQRQLYDAHVAQLKESLSGQSSEDFKTSKIKVLAELTRLRQLCCDPALVYDNYKAMSAKVETCMDLVGEAVDGGHKVLLFSQFTTLLETLHKRFDKEGISYFSLTGSTSKEKRMKLVESFNEDETSVFCISLKAGGTGLNLTSADIVIHFDPWWNVAVQNQATDRAHRIGQKNVVNVYKLIVKDSIEEKIMKLQERKQALSDQMLSGEKMGVASFSKEELLEILG